MSSAARVAGATPASAPADAVEVVAWMREACACLVDGAWTDAPGASARLLDALRAAHAADATLRSVVSPATAAVDLAVLAAHDAAYLAYFAAVCEPAARGELIRVATHALMHASATFFSVPWTHGIARVRRAMRLACSVLVALAAVGADAAWETPLVEAMHAIKATYGGVLARARVPDAEASSSAAPWPLAWLLAKADALAAADAALALAAAIGASTAVCACLEEDMRAREDACVSLVDASLRADLDAASCASLPARLRVGCVPFPGVAWAAVRAALRMDGVAAATPAAAPADPGLVEMIAGILPQADRADIARRLRRPKYQGQSAEEVLGHFLDDPDGLGDMDAEAPPPPPPPPASANDVDALSADLKASILARADASDEEMEPDRAESLLLQAYRVHGDALFARDKKARARPERAQLRDALAPFGVWDDGRIEDWAALLVRNHD
ncbi:hypothetical protein MSPP1_002569 [Malassezia sp. CBS 17886]|nr:hypothetical protein MSPP1_002569 [Malassezia sp. CBS 17886]